MNRTIFTADNLHILERMPDACVDLIYLDPPFNSNRNYAAPVGSQGAEIAFKDTWTLQDIDLAEHGLLADTHPALYEIINAAGLAHGNSAKSYLVYMAARLLQMHRVLKPTGSIYLHCDDTMVHYLKVLMDAIFGRTNYRNNIIWRRTTSNSQKIGYSRVADHLLYYTKDHTQRTWNQQHRAHDPVKMKKEYRYQDEHGTYKHDNLTAPGTSANSTMPWGHYSPEQSGRSWAPPRWDKLPPHVQHTIDEQRYNNAGVHAKLEFLDRNNLLHTPNKPNGVPKFKRYLHTSKGRPLNNIFDDIPNIAPTAKERTGYPTQKPLQLLERIISASSNPGDIVLDPFCGCATTCVAAERLGRQWLGIDISPLAVRLVNERLKKELGAEDFQFQVAHMETWPTSQGPSKPRKEDKHTRYALQDGVCPGCRVHFPLRNMTIDHMQPQSRGGAHSLENLQLLCGACNSEKGNKTQAEWVVYRQEKGLQPIMEFQQ